MQDPSDPSEPVLATANADPEPSLLTEPPSPTATDPLSSTDTPAQPPDAPGTPDARRLRVLRVYHSAVVAGWRQRDRALREQGHEVTLVTTARWNEGGSPIDFDPAGDGFVTPAATLGSRPNLFVYDPRPLWRLLGQGPYDLLDFHEEPCSLAMAELLALRWLRRAKRAPFVVYSAQNIEKRYPPPFRWVERWCLHQAAGAYPCNREAGRILAAKGLRPAPTVLPLGVELSSFAAGDTAAPDPAGADFRIGYVGRLTEHKGVRVLLEAAAKLPGASVELAGAGPQHDQLRQLAVDLGTAGRTRFRGYLAQHDLPAFYRSLHVTVVPSVPQANWDEQFCRVAVESMASGVPVVASDTGALPEVLGGAGVLVPPGDPAALAAALERLAAEPGRWAERRAAGLARAQHFSWSAVAAAHGRLYRQAAAPASPADPASPASATPPRLEVAVVAYGPPDPLGRTLRALQGRFPVTVVDNSPSAETRALVGAVGGRYVDAGANVGFAAGVNLALRAIGPGADVLLLNPDATITPAGVLRLQHALHRRPRTAAAAPGVVDPTTGAPARVGWPFPSPRRAWWEAVGLGRFRWRDDFLIGAVLLLRAEAVAEVGPFDERFFLYAEETDWQRRARGAGWQVMRCDEVVATHVGAGTGGDPRWRETLFHSSIERYVRKWYGDAGWRRYRAAVLVREAARAAVFTGERRAAARRRFGLYRRGPIEASGRNRAR